MGMKQHRSGCFHNRAIESLRNPVLLGSVGVGELMRNSEFAAVSLEFIRGVLSTIVAAYYVHSFDSTTGAILHHLSVFLEFG